MHQFKNQLSLAAAALAISVALAVAWLGDLWLNTAPWVVRWGLLGLGLMLSATCVGLLLNWQKREQQTARRGLDQLCRLEPHELRADGPPLTLPYLPHDSEWKASLDNVREALARSTERVQHLEQARAALEIRARRNEAYADRMSAILATLPEPVIAVDSFGELVLSNASADKLFNLQHSSEKQALAQLVQCETLVQLLSETRRRKVPTHRTGEVEIADPEGQPRWYSVIARNLGGEGSDESAQGAVAVLRDISVQKAAQKRNAEFVSAVSHEMKTPLAGIKAYVELLVDGDADDEVTREEFLSVINSQANRLQRLVDNLLNLARIEAGVVSVSKLNRSLNELLEEALRICQPAADAKQIELVSDLSPLYLSVHVDRDMMLQAAMNLLSNAIKYTPEGGRVTLRSRRVDNEVRFEVIDTGVGLSAEDCHKVFEKFYRVQKNKDMAAGTGLGLPLAKHLVEDVHGGKLYVESALGQGSTFTVLLRGAGELGGRNALLATREETALVSS